MKTYKVINKRTGKIVRYFDANRKRDVPYHEINEKVELHMNAMKYRKYLDELAKREKN